MAIRNKINETHNIRQVYAPVQQAAGSVTTDTYDTCGSGNSRAESGLLLVNVGAITGSPDAGNMVVYTLYDKELSSDSYAATALTLTIADTDANTLKKLEFKPSAYKRFQSWRYTATFSNGTSPKIFLSCTELRGELAQLPGNG